MSALDDESQEAGVAGGETPSWSKGHHTPLEYHRTLIDDTMRVDAYERAIRALVKPGDVVLDLGCGSGLLAMLAARRGARVHAVESMSVAKVARQLVEANGLQALVTVHHADVSTLDPVEPVDLMVSEFMGRFLIDDGMLPIMPYAARWLKPGARCCPSRVDLMLAPVGDFHLYAVDSLLRSHHGLDYSAALPYALNYCYRAHLQPYTLMAPAVCYHEYRPPEVARPFDRSLSFTLERAGRLQAIAGWFVAELSPEVTLETTPGMENHWGQYLFPLPPRRLPAGANVSLRLWLESDDEEQHWRWSGEIDDGEEVTAFEFESRQKLGERSQDGPWRVDR